MNLFSDLNRQFALYSLGNWLIFDPKRIAYDAETDQKRAKILRRMAMNKVRLIHLLEDYCRESRQNAQNKKHCPITFFEPFREISRKNNNPLLLWVPPFAKLQFLIWFFLVLNFHYKTKYYPVKVIALTYNMIITFISIFGIFSLFFSTFPEGFWLSKRIWYIFSTAFAIVASICIVIAQFLNYSVSGHYESENIINFKSSREKFILKQLQHKTLLFFINNPIFWVDLAIIVLFYMSLAINYVFWGPYEGIYIFIATVLFVRCFLLITFFNGSFALHIMKTVFRENFKTTMLVLMVYFVLVVIGGAFFYALESPFQPDAFKSAFTGSYFSAISVATVGFGELTPITFAGRMTFAVLGIIPILYFGLISFFVTETVQLALRNWRKTLSIAEDYSHRALVEIILEKRDDELFLEKFDEILRNSPFFTENNRKKIFKQCGLKIHPKSQKISKFLFELPLNLKESLENEALEDITGSSHPTKEMLAEQEILKKRAFFQQSPFFSEDYYNNASTPSEKPENLKNIPKKKRKRKKIVKKLKEIEDIDNISASSSSSKRIEKKKKRSNSFSFSTSTSLMERFDFAKHDRIQEKGHHDLSNSQRAVLGAFLLGIGLQQKNSKDFQRIKNFTIVKDPFSEDFFEIVQKLQIKRIVCKNNEKQKMNCEVAQP